jgi:hypothetical protein
VICTPVQRRRRSSTMRWQIARLPLDRQSFGNFSFLDRLRMDNLLRDHS